MRYQLEDIIDAPRERVLELFLDPDCLKHWQPSLVRFEALSGNGLSGVGAQSKQLHRMGSREVEMISTVTVENYPAEFAATFEADDVWNLVGNQFEETDDGRTRWILVSDFRSTSFMMKCLMFFAPGLFKKQTREFMGYFKDFVETGKSAA